MFDDDIDSLFVLGAGPLVAIVLGFALIPLRGVTTASNFTFAFLALIIVVAEYGGRWAALATALTSALSLDFFLTEPYLKLSIADKHDAIAFAGLAACGLVAATLGGQRGRRDRKLERLQKQSDLVGAVLQESDLKSGLELQLAHVLRKARGAFPLAAAVVRDEHNAVLAGTSPDAAQRPVPHAALVPDVLERRGRPLPAEGARLPLIAGGRAVGSLDIWGNERYADSESRRALYEFARLTALLLAARAPGEHGRGGPHKAV